MDNNQQAHRVETVAMPTRHPEESHIKSHIKTHTGDPPKVSSTAANFENQAAPCDSGCNPATERLGFFFGGGDGGGIGRLGREGLQAIRGPIEVARKESLRGIHGHFAVLGGLRLPHMRDALVSGHSLYLITQMFDSASIWIGGMATQEMFSTSQRVHESHPWLIQYGFVGLWPWRYIWGVIFPIIDAGIQPIIDTGDFQMTFVGDDFKNKLPFGTRYGQSIGETCQEKINAIAEHCESRGMRLGLESSGIGVGGKSPGAQTIADRCDLFVMHDDHHIVHLSEKELFEIAMARDDIGRRYTVVRAFDFGPEFYAKVRGAGAHGPWTTNKLTDGAFQGSAGEQAMERMVRDLEIEMFA